LKGLKNFKVEEQATLKFTRRAGIDSSSGDNRDFLLCVVCGTVEVRMSILTATDSYQLAGIRTMTNEAVATGVAVISL